MQRHVRTLALLCIAALQAFAQVPWPIAEWAISTPEAEGMRTAKLLEADAWLRQRPGILPGSEGGNRYSFLVVRNGRIVFERYYNGALPGDANHIASVSKSLLSGVAGVAVNQSIISLDEKWFDTFPQYRSVVRDGRTLDLNVRNILTMTGGLVWREDRDIIGALFSSDWIAYVLSRDFVAPPGQVFNYSTGLSHMISALIAEKSHLTTREFAETNLFNPIGMRIGDWWTDPKGYHGGGWGIHTTPRDLAKFGYLYLREGEWNGQRIVPRDWVRTSIAPLMRSGAGDDDFYGYFWRMDNRRGFFMPDASGMGDQHLWYSRDLDLVVVTTGQWDYLFETGDMWHLMHDFVVPAVFSGPPAVNDGGVVNAAGGRTVAAPDSFVSIYGTNLAPVPVHWDSVILDGKTLPIELGAVSVKVSGKPAWLSYSGPNQVNILVPPDVEPGTAEVDVTHPGGTVKTWVTVAPVSPGLFNAATFAGEQVWVGEPGSLPGVASRPARRGDNLELYANGLGPTAEVHPTGQVLPKAYPIADASGIRVFLNDVEVMPQAVNMTYAGLWQINIQVPQNAPSGNVAVTVRAGGQTSPPVTFRFE